MFKCKQCNNKFREPQPEIVIPICKMCGCRDVLLFDKEQIIKLIESQIAGYEFVLDVKAANVCRLILKEINELIGVN
jgi:DNA polymerase II large subunit